MGMKLLFERLTSDPDWQLKAAVQTAVAQLTATETLSEEDVPPGILDFGLPHVVELGPGPSSLVRYGEALARRIEQFEPRLRIIAIDVVDKQLQITAQLTSNGEAITWRVNG